MASHDTSKAPKLTIAIPTYNRPAALRRLVEALLAQIDSRTTLLVVDNRSEKPAAEVLADLQPRYPALFPRIVCNPVNIGGNPNFLRCIELAETEWVWVFGDDDLPEARAVATVLESIDRHATAVAINFASGLLKFNGLERPETTIAPTLEQLPGCMDSFSNFLFISANVYRRPAILPQIRVAYMWAHSCAPQVALILGALRDGAGECVFSRELVVQWEPPAAGEGWSPTPIYSRLPEVLMLINDSPTAVQLARLNGRSHPLPWPPPKRSKSHLIDLATNYPTAAHRHWRLAELFRTARVQILVAPDSAWRVARDLFGRCMLLAMSPLLSRLYAGFRSIFHRRKNMPDTRQTQDADALIGDKRF